MKVRRGRPEDIEAIRKLGKEFYTGTRYAASGVKYSPTTVYNLLMGLMGESGIVCVAEDEGEIVGFVLLALHPFPFNAKHLCASELAYYVNPAYRKSGVGKTLLGKAEQVAQQKGATFISMVALQSGDPVSAEAVYSRMGYEKNEVTFTKDL